MYILFWLRSHCSEFRIIDPAIFGIVHWHHSLVMNKFRRLVKRFNDELNRYLLVEVFDMTSPLKGNDGHVTIVVKDIPGDLDCLCYNHHDQQRRSMRHAWKN